MTNNNSKSSQFVDYIIKLCEKDNAARAVLKRADNPATEYKSWEILCAFNIDLEKNYERLPYAAISAYIARADVKTNGNLGLGRLISNSYQDGSNNDAAKAKLRRFLACTDSIELLGVMRPFMSFASKAQGNTPNYALLLDDLLWFNIKSDTTKPRWATEFYNNG